jgi:hypothetical protein
MIKQRDLASSAAALLVDQRCMVKILLRRRHGILGNSSAVRPKINL